MSIVTNGKDIFRSTRQKRTLHCANGTQIRTYGTTHLNVITNGKDALPWQFIIADSTYNIIGMDFISHHGFVVDIKHKLLTSKHHTISGKIKHDTKEVNSVSTIPKGLHRDITNLLCKYASITKPLQYSDMTDSHGITHSIETKSSKPISCTPRPLHGTKARIAQDAFSAMEKQGIVSQGSSAWASPLHMVPKRDRSYRVVGDFRKLNAVTVPDRYPIPHLLNFSDRLAGAKFFSTLDLRSAYHQIAVEPADRPKTAITTPWGKMYLWNRMPFGLRNSGSTFQRFINHVLRDISNIFVYLDDILVFTETRDEHLKVIESIFNRMQTYQTTLNVEKCTFLQREVTFLGHVVNEKGITISREKVRSIEEFPVPKTVRSLKRFLGVVNFYRSFLKNAALILSPLTKFLSEKYKKIVLAKHWGTDQQQAFDTVKKMLASEIYLAYPRPGVPLVVITDASLSAIGGVLNQIVHGKMEPLAFFSKGLNAAQQKYPAFDRELLAGYKAIRHFQPYIATETTWYTDHKPLIAALTADHPKITARAQRHLQYISSMITEAKHISGINNVVADCLSRAECAAIFETIPAIDLSKFYNAQMADAEIKGYIESNPTKVKCVAKDNYCFYVNTETAIQRPIVPETLRQQIFDVSHCLAHPGYKATTKLISKNYFYPRMYTDIKKRSKCCLKCQRNKVGRHNISPIGVYKEPEARFRHLNLDFIGPLPPINGYRYVLTAVCRFSRYPFAIAVQDQTADNLCNAFMNGIVAHVGAPETITTDRGKSFLSNKFQSLLTFLGTKHVKTTSFHPQSNGMAERFNKSLKVALRAQEEPNSWLTNLGFVMLALRNIVKPELGVSPANMTFCQELRLPGQFVESTVESNRQVQNPYRYGQYYEELSKYAQKLQTQPPRYTPRKSFLAKELETCTHVFIKNKPVHKALEVTYNGPYKVICRTDKLFTVDLPKNDTTHNVISIDRIKPATLLNTFDAENTVPAQHFPQPNVVQTDIISPVPKSSNDVPIAHNTPNNHSFPDNATTRAGRQIRIPARFK